MVRQAFFWTALSQLMNFVVQFGASIVVARLLSPRELGVFAVATSIIGIVQVISMFGVGSYLIKEPELDHDTVGTANFINALIAVCTSAGILLCALFGERIFHDATVKNVLLLLSIPPLLSIPSFLPSTLLQKQMKLRGMSIAGTVNMLLTSIVTVVAALLGQSSLSPAYGWLVGSVFSTAMMVAIGREHFSLAMSVKHWRPITKFGLQLLSVGGVLTIASRISDLIVARMLGIAALGLYSRANNLSGMLYNNVYGTAARVMFPKLSEAHRHGTLGPTYILSLRILLGVMSPVLFGTAVLSGPFIVLLYGPKWLGAAVPLSLVVMAQWVALTCAMVWEVYVLNDRIADQSKVEVMKSVLNVCTQAIGALFSLSAVAATAIVDNLFSVSIYHRTLPGILGVPRAVLSRAYRESFLLGCVGAAPAALVMLVARWDPRLGLPYVAGSVVLGGLAWLGSCIAIGHPVIPELNRALSKLTGGRYALAVRA